MGYLVLPSCGQIHTEDCKKLHKKLKGDGVKTMGYCECPHCSICTGLRMEWLNRFE